MQGGQLGTGNPGTGFETWLHQRVGVWRWESELMARMMSRFPRTVTTFLLKAVLSSLTCYYFCRDRQCRLNRIILSAKPKRWIPRWLASSGVSSPLAGHLGGGDYNRWGTQPWALSLPDKELCLRPLLSCVWNMRVFPDDARQ